jgi:hypothetical protein
MRVVVTGSLEWTGIQPWRVMTRVLFLANPDEVGHGDARGADSMADGWCRAHSVPLRRYRADWRPNGRFDIRAGFRRNAAMLADFEPDLVLAFKDGFDFSFRRGGTENTVKLALGLGVPVQVWSSDFRVVHLPRYQQLLLGSCQSP